MQIICVCVCVKLCKTFTNVLWVSRSDTGMKEQKIAGRKVCESPLPPPPPPPSHTHTCMYVCVKAMQNIYKIFCGWANPIQYWKRRTEKRRGGGGMHESPPLPCSVRYSGSAGIVCFIYLNMVTCKILALSHLAVFQQVCYSEETHLQKVIQYTTKFRPGFVIRANRQKIVPPKWKGPIHRCFWRSVYMKLILQHVIYQNMQLYSLVVSLMCLSYMYIVQLHEDILRPYLHTCAYHIILKWFDFAHRHP